MKALAEKENLSYDEAKKKFLSNFHASKEAVKVSDVCIQFFFLFKKKRNLKKKSLS